MPFGGVKASGYGRFGGSACWRVEDWTSPPSRAPSNEASRWPGRSLLVPAYGAPSGRFRLLIGIHSGGARLALALTAAALSWAAATFLLWLWRKGRVHTRILLLATAAELGLLYYTSTTTWGWAVRLPDQSPVLALLAKEPNPRPGRRSGS